jgi:hypothetical protein
MESERIVVTGGHPTDAELTAVTLALAQHRRPERSRAATRRSRWIHAARLESCGHPPIDSPMALNRVVPTG